MNITNASNFIVRNDSTNAYLKDIKKFPVMTKQEEMDLFAKYEDSVTRLASVKENFIEGSHLSLIHI